MLDIDEIKIILDKIELSDDTLESELIEKSFFKKNIYKKIKKKLIYEIASARIREIFDIMLLKNINLSHFNKTSNNIFLEINHKSQFKCLKEIFKKNISINGDYKINFKNFSNESTLN